MFDSPHFANWLSLHSDQPIDFRLVPSSPHRRIHPTLSGLQSAGHPAKYSWSTATSSAAVPIWLVDKFFFRVLGSRILRQEIRNFRPDFIHALELQHAGYIALAALRKGAVDAKLILTNYGSDIYWFSRFPGHRRKIQALLRIAGRYSCECERDVRLALQNGFSGEVMPVRPNAGFFSKETLDNLLSSNDKRNLIMIKGYQGWAGRAVVALRAIEQVATELQGARVVVYSTNLVTMLLARIISHRSKIFIETKAKGSMTRNEMLKLFSEAKIYVGLSRTDGISTSLLEAMAMGAIPVQTATACCDEWFDETGVKVEDLSVEAVADAILQGLELAKDPSNRDINRETIRAKASEAYVKDAAIEFYR